MTELKADDAKVYNIFQRMSMITDELQTVAKNLSVDTGNGKSYKAVSERDIIDAVKPVEVKHGVYSYPYMREILESQMLEEDNSKYGKRTKFYTKIVTTYRFVNVDKPEEFIDIVSFSVGLDSGDKGDGKAMTYGDKYALMKAYKISTGDDPDAKASEDSVYTRSGVPKSARPASDADRQKIMTLCKAMGVSHKEVLSETGWEEGSRLTQEQADKAIMILKEISESRQ